MADERRRQAEAIFQEAADAPPGARSGLLRERCGGDSALRRDVEKLLTALDEGAHDLLETPAYRITRPGLDRGPAGAEMPTHVGKYEIRRLIGQGGMGAVFEAWQESPSRAVALKLMQPGLFSEDLLKRFHREAQVLGALHHPGIAAIYEAGSATVRTASGLAGGHAGEQPFFAMELVRGLPLLEHADAHGLGVNERLELLARVCDAVHHAHQMGVVHRDLKPANILVDATTSPAQPKVLDFGVARALEADLRTIAAPARSRPTATGAGVLVGTIPYMSPEQVAGEPDAIDARSDVYGLGVVLFELLTGKLPLALKGRSIPEAARMIRDDEPSRLSSVNPAFRGDLETIVQKALEKDRARRYASAVELGGDIRRFLTHQPISARPNSTFYQLRKFARRNRALVGGICATFLVLTLGVCAATLLALREAEQRRRADKRTAEAEQQAYRSTLSAAQVMLQSNRAIDAKKRLATTPPELRAWEWRHLNWLADRSERTLNGPDEPAGGAALSGDGRRLAAVVPAGIAVWRLPEGERTTTIKHSLGRIASMALNADGSRVLLGGDEIAMLDSGTGQTRWRLPRAGASSAHAFSPDGERVAVFVTGEPQIQVLEAQSGDVVCAIPLPVSNVSVPVYSPVREHIAFSVNKLPQMFDARDGSLVWRGPPEAAKLDMPEPVYFAPGGGAVVLRPWMVLDAATGAARGRVCSTGLAGCLSAERVASVEQEHIVLKDARTEDRICTLAQQQAIGFTPDGRWLVTRSDAGEIKVWDAAVMEAPMTASSVADSTFSSCFSSDARLLATGSWGFVRVWDAATGAERSSTFAARRSVMSVAFSPDDSVIAAGALGGVVRFVDAASGARRGAGAQLPMREDVKSVAWDPRGGRVYVTTSSPRIYAVEESGAWSVFAGVSEGAQAIWAATSTTGPARLAAGVTHGETGEVCMWDLASGKLLWSMACQPSLTGAFAGERLLTAELTGPVRIYDVQAGAEVGAVSLRTPMTCAALSPEGKLVVGHADATLSICDLESGGEVLGLALPGRAGGARAEPIRAIRFSMDGRSLLASGARTALASFESGSPVGGHAARDRVRRVREAVDGLYGQSMMPDQAVEALAQRDDLPDEIGDEAIALVRSRGAHLPAINSRVWETVRYAGRPEAERREALRDIEAVCAAAPEEWSYVNTLGIAQYRVGDYARALETLKRSETLMESVGAGSTPANGAFIAMCHHHLGRGDLAVAALERARADLRLAAPRSGGLVEDQAFVREAEGVIGGR